MMLALSTLKAASSSRAPVAARFNSTQAGNGPDASFGSATRSTVPPRSTHATYHPGGYGISQGLKRARKPYRVRNILTGSLIVAFATSVYFYSISKVGSAIPLLIPMTRLLTLYQSSTLLISRLNRSNKMTSPTLPRSEHQQPLILSLSLPSRITNTKYDPAVLTKPVHC